MSTPLFIIGQLITLVLCAGLFGSIYTSVRKGLSKLKLPVEQQKRAALLSVSALGIWTMILAGGALLLQQEANSAGAVLSFAYLLPVAVGLALLGFRFFRLLLRATPPSWLVKVQGIRIIVSLLLWLGYQGQYVPPQLTFLWFNYDIVVGVSALMGSYAFFARGRLRRPEILLWNSFGLFSLWYLVGIALVSVPGSWQLFETSPDGTFLLQPIFILLQGFIFPLCSLWHVYSIWQALSRPLSKSFGQRLSQRTRY
ncbi:hypothetical protein [Phaeodactylibacter luteus]|uniref:Uncharacterized protein n=1 Tax=Phaeodactylibacter luteus TaxID=1564516 RepID=A0A5C6RZW8_9BACT|nr:hypothetical protein [Phaeodactylibacter luteus]TXB67657.1 hypothetical protein FRY97_04510 [Phaeodactylibacter luteus]